jgi:hypothetical protein
MDSMLEKLNKACPALVENKLGDFVNTVKSSSIFQGAKVYLDPVNGLDSNNGLTYDTPKKTWDEAYGKLVANRNDILYIIGGASAINAASLITWDKSYTHCVGLTTPGPYSRCRIGHNADFATLFLLSANGCIFSNLHWQQGRGSATNLNCFVIAATANYNYFQNCHFDAPLHATEANAAYRILTLTGSGAVGARSNTFNNCWIGDWSIPGTSTTGQLVNIGDMTAGTQFIDCKFIINTTQATMVPIAAASSIGGGNVAGYIYFKDCEFLALNTTVNVGFTAPTSGKILLSNCRSVKVTAWCSTNANVQVVNNFTGSASAGLGSSS